MLNEAAPVGRYRHPPGRLASYAYPAHVFPSAATAFSQAAASRMARDPSLHVAAVERRVARFVKPSLGGGT